MCDLKGLESNEPAALSRIVQVITRLSALDEAHILEIVSSGKIQALVPFRPASCEIPADTVLESDLVEASFRPSR